jgi:signal transduction histidine kinase
MAFAGGAIALALLVAWLVLGLLFERHLQRQSEAELERHGTALIAALSLDAQGRPRLAAQPFDPRFDRPAGGLYWRLSTPAGELRSRSLWDGTLPDPPGPPGKGWGAAVVAGPFEERLVLVVRDIRLDRAGPEVLVEVAADRAPLAAARARFDGELGLFLLVLWLTLTLAAFVQVRLGLAPLDRLRRDLGDLRRDPAARFAAGAHPREVEPLTQAINALADQRAEDLDRARRRARDLAHALKTPLTALRLQAETLGGEEGRAMTQSLSLLGGAVEGELARVGALAPAGAGALAAVVVERLVAVLRRTPDGARLAFETDLASDLVLPLAEEAALETLGALLDNAARHARSRVRLEGGVEDGRPWLSIIDDGIGIPADLRDAVLARGVRLDERGANHGLGLPIACSFVTASGGNITLGDTPGGGLTVRLAW